MASGGSWAGCLSKKWVPVLKGSENHSTKGFVAKSVKGCSGEQFPLSRLGWKLVSLPETLTWSSSLGRRGRPSFGTRQTL